MRTRRQFAEQRAREMLREQVQRELLEGAADEVEPEMLATDDEVDAALAPLCEVSDPPRPVPPPLPPREARPVLVTDDMLVTEVVERLPGGYGTQRYFKLGKP